MEPRTELIRLHEAACQRPPNPPVEHVNLVICRGEVAGLIAPDDAMKQMLLDLLTGRLPPCGGRILPPGAAETAFFGYTVNGENFFGDLTVTDNLLWISGTRRRLILSDARARRQAQALLDRYGLRVSPAARLSSLTLTERYALEIVKAIEVFRVRLLVIDRIHLVECEAAQQRLLALTDGFRAAGGAVVVSSILRLPVFQQAARTYLLQNGQPIRTLFSSAHNVHRAHMDLLFSDYLQHAVSAMLPQAPDRGGAARCTLRVTGRGGETAFGVEPGEVLGVYAPQAADDRSVDRLLSGGRLSIRCGGREVRAAGLADLVREDVGYFPKQVEDIMFYRLNLKENLEIFAYRKLCRIPGVISARLERYFMAHCVTADEATARASDLSQIRHSTVLQTAVSRYLQRTWKLMLIHIPTFVCNTLEYHIMQNFVATLSNKGTAVVLLSSDQRSLRPFCAHVVELPER